MLNAHSLVKLSLPGARALFICASDMVEFKLNVI